MHEYKTHQFDGHDGLVVVGELVVQGHDHTVGHDGDDDDPLEGGPVDQPGHEPPHRAGGREEEEAGRPPVVRLVLFLFHHGGGGHDGESPSSAPPATMGGSWRPAGLVAATECDDTFGRKLF